MICRPSAQHERNEKLSGKKNKRVALEKASNDSPKNVSSLLEPHGGRGRHLIPILCMQTPGRKKTLVKMPDIGARVRAKHFASTGKIASMNALWYASASRGLMCVCVCCAL
jgi:hypothetical protein